MGYTSHSQHWQHSEGRVSPGYLSLYWGWHATSCLELNQKVWWQFPQIHGVCVSWGCLDWRKDEMGAQEWECKEVHSKLFPFRLYYKHLQYCRSGRGTLHCAPWCSISFWLRGCSHSWRECTYVQSRKFCWETVLKVSTPLARTANSLSRGVRNEAKSFSWWRPGITLRHKRCSSWVRIYSSRLKFWIKIGVAEGPPWWCLKSR